MKPPIANHHMLRLALGLTLFSFLVGLGCSLQWGLDPYLVWSGMLGLSWLGVVARVARSRSNPAERKAT